MSIPMLGSEDIAGKRFLKFESVVELLKEEKEKGNLFADFPIGATIQDGGKRKRSDDMITCCCCCCLFLFSIP